jgi:hypothetical protein
MSDARWGDDPRDRDSGSRDLSRGSRGGSDPRDRERVDPRDVFMEHVNLPRGVEREHVGSLRRASSSLTLTRAFTPICADDCVMIRSRFSLSSPEKLDQILRSEVHCDSACGRDSE